MTPPMLNAGIKNSSLDGMFEFVLSTEQAKIYKPDPRACQIGVDAFGVKHEEIVFAAFAGWDAVSAKWLGYPTVWVNRFSFADEKMDMSADAGGKDMSILKRFVKAQ